MAESRSRTKRGKDISATILVVYGCRRCYYRQKGKKLLVPYVIVYCYLTYFIYDVSRNCSLAIL